jgi:hypothetical protein
MSVFNNTFANLLEDGYIELDNLEEVYHYMKRLNHISNERIGYSVVYKWNWINECDAWLISIVK